MALVGGGAHRDNAEATPGGCRVATVGKGALARHVKRDVPCALALLAAYGGWAQRWEGAIVRLLHRGMRPRLASLLLELDVRAGRGAPDAGALGRDGGLLPGSSLPGVGDPET